MEVEGLKVKIWRRKERVGGRRMIPEKVREELGEVNRWKKKNQGTV